MKLLFDQNLPPRLVDALASHYAESQHVSIAGLARAADIAIWDYAKDHGLTIVSKDSDFMQMSFLHGFPPKVIWIRRGNCPTGELEDLLRTSLETVRRFVESSEEAYLILR